MEKQKLGTVSYINTLPLIYKLDKYELIKKTPYELVDLYNKKQIICALLPIYEVLRVPGSFIIEGISISSRKMAGSVLCFLNKKLQEIKKVALDKSSLSSIHLLKLLFRRYFQINCSYEIIDSDLILKNKEQFDAYLLIGDNAIYHRKINKTFFDLGTLWYEWTGYPFVFAVWTTSKKLEDLKFDLIESKEAGLSNIDRVISRIDFPNKDFLLNYYKNYLCFDLADKEKSAIKLYQNMLYEEGYYLNLYEPLYY